MSCIITNLELKSAKNVLNATKMRRKVQKNKERYSNTAPNFQRKKVCFWHILNGKDLRLDFLYHFQNNYITRFPCILLLCIISLNYYYDSKFKVIFNFFPERTPDKNDPLPEPRKINEFSKAEDDSHKIAAEKFINDVAIDLPPSNATMAMAQSSETSTENLSHYHDYDIGTINSEFLQSDVVNDIIRQGHQEWPSSFPRDRYDEKFSTSLLNKILPNGEIVKRDWLVWSRSKNAFFCLPCRLLSTSTLNRPKLCRPEGYSKCQVWKKLHEKLPSHENNRDHVQCYIQWRSLKTRIENDASIDRLLDEQITIETKKWNEILHRILDTILFLGERGLAFRGDSNLLGERNNGNFLGILELISHYDPILQEHLEKVRISQQQHKRLQVHYLSASIQNEFIDICAQHVKSAILEERKKAKYFAIIVDATPDSSHVEQTTFILRYLYLNQEKKFIVQERFLAFVDCNQKTGQAIADLICKTLEEYNIPLEDCRAQGYDNGANMKGLYNGAQRHILDKNPIADYSPCATHSLNLCGVDSAECCTAAITFFGVVQKCYTCFSSSPQRWEILKENVPGSLHRLSDTRWSARVQAVKPFANHIPGLQKALEGVLELNLTVETRTDVNGVLMYIKKFECILLSSIWFKILSAIDERNIILQARQATIDIEIQNIESLLSELNMIRNQWDQILCECKMVAVTLGISSTFPVTRKRKHKRCFQENEDDDTNADDPETDFKVNTFLVIVDSVIVGVSRRFAAMKNLHKTFAFLWQFGVIDETAIREAVGNFVKKYKSDVSRDLEDELIHLKHIYNANFDEKLSPFELLNAIYVRNLETIFPNVCVALRVYCTIPVTVSSAERSFSVLARIKNFHRSCSTQERVSGLGTLCIEAPLARQLDFDSIIKTFATQKARKAHV